MELNKSACRYAALFLLAATLPSSFANRSISTPDDTHRSSTHSKLLRGTHTAEKSSTTRNLQFKSYNFVFCSDSWCHVNAECTPVMNENNMASYRCACDLEDGWIGDGVDSCSDLNECANANQNSCVPVAEGGFCEDRHPNDADTAKYACGCLPGFEAGPNSNEHGPTECLNIDECTLRTHECHEEAHCTDTDGAYDCTCAPGLVGDGKASCALDAHDLGIRFSKIKFKGNNIPVEATLPLSAPLNYPMNEETFRWLRYSEAHSVTIKEVCVECDISFFDLIDSIGGSPLHPTTDATSPFWGELEHVVDIQVLRRVGNVDPQSIMPMPALWAGRSMDEVANSVHDEYPGIQHVALIQVMDGSTNGLTVDTNIIPFTVKVEFIRRIVMVADLVTWAIARVGPLNFGVKWSIGRVRPEEIAYQISEAAAGSALTAAVPPSLMTKIKDLGLTSGEDFTAYQEGSPDHPSWPAMHSAGSAASLWMAVVLDLTDDEWCEVKLTDYAVSYARTVAGVHYVTDNIAGLALGQEIVARRLPEYLNEKYGSDIVAVESKVASMRFDWNTFLSSDCAKQNGMFAL